MRARIQQWIYHIHGSYWFVPALMAIAAIILSQAAVQFDRQVGAGWMTDNWWASLNQPEGARALLATVSGSMITVAGVTFSLTILAMSYATSHYGPRLLDNFMHDRGNQVTLGMFVATFLYCLLVLRTVRSGSTGDRSGLETEVFVPHFAVLVAIALTLASVAVLIYFIHHIPESIHISNVLHRISCQLSTKFDELYPEQLGQPDEIPEDTDLPGPDEPRAVRAAYSGYLQGIDDTALMNFTGEHDAVIELLVRPGEYLLEGQKIALLHTCDDDATDLQDCDDHVNVALAIGVSRTPTQDVHFLINQFVEIATRALSPGVNDPFTAIQCIEGLSTALVRVSHRSLPSRYRKDQAGKLRVITTEPTWKQLVEGAFGRLIPYVVRDVNVRNYLDGSIDAVCDISSNEDLNRSLRDVQSRLRDATD